MIIDIIVIVILLISAFIAFLRGFIRETLTILGVVGGLAAAFFGGPMLSPFVREWMGIKEGAEPEKLYDLVPLSLVADVLSYGAIFIVVVIVLSVLSHVLAESAKAIGLGAVDRTLGVLFGLARGVVLIALLYLPFHLVIDAETKKVWFHGSKTYVYLEKSGEILTGLLPKDMQEPPAEGTEEAGAPPSPTRQRLEEIDLLKKVAPHLLAPQPQEPAAPEGEQPGYPQETRQNMEQLIEDNAQTAPEEGNR